MRRFLFFALFSFAFTNPVIFPVDYETLNTACVTSDGLPGTQKLSEHCKSLQKEVFGFLKFVGPVVCCPQISKAKDYCDKHGWEVPNLLSFHIFGGDLADVAEFPQMAALGYTSIGDETVFDCGGSLITEKFVISAAHCFSKKRQYPTFVRFGRVS